MTDAGALTVFLFMAALMGGAALSGWLFARWQSQETKRDINDTFDKIKKILRQQGGGEVL